MRPEDDFELPVFDRPMDETPSPMTCEQAMAAFEQIIQSRRLREEEPQHCEVIEPFVM